MTIYKRLSVVEREAIKSGVTLGKTQSDIAKELKRNKSTISRELGRMELPQELYSPWQLMLTVKKSSRLVRLVKRKSKQSLQIKSKTTCLKGTFLLNKSAKRCVSNFQMIVRCMLLMKPSTNTFTLRKLRLSAGR